ncbi:MAG: hypothetical protein HRT42_01275 [Campylobacteraceae bacterium]|nr:hypothetical protein [Campylobacteraceae bacterium]
MENQSIESKVLEAKKNLQQYYTQIYLVIDLTFDEFHRIINDCRLEEIEDTINRLNARLNTLIHNLNTEKDINDTKMISDIVFTCLALLTAVAPPVGGPVSAVFIIIDQLLLLLLKETINYTIEDELSKKKKELNEGVQNLGVIKKLNSKRNSINTSEVEKYLNSKMKLLAESLNYDTDLKKVTYVSADSALNYLKAKIKTNINKSHSMSISSMNNVLEFTNDEEEDVKIFLDDTINDYKEGFDNLSRHQDLFTRVILSGIVVSIFNKDKFVSVADIAISDGFVPNTSGYKPARSTTSISYINFVNTESNYKRIEPTETFVIKSIPILNNNCITQKIVQYITRLMQENIEDFNAAEYFNTIYIEYEDLNN